jgi:TctA family transporter
VIGVAPGAGSTVAGFVSYASATKTCKNPETFGKGDVRGVIAGETALHVGLFEALSISDNGIWIFFMRIPSLIIFLCILTVIFWPYIERLYKKPRVTVSQAK